jgi:hypothetical protein
MSIASGEERKTIARFDGEEIKDINSRNLAEESKTVEARFTAYDRDAGIGKLDLVQEDVRRLTFAIPPGNRTALRPRVLKAMDLDAVVTSVRFFRDKSGAFTSAIVQDIEV